MPRSQSRVLSLRALNRATLARQLLLERAGLPVIAATEALVGLQSQLPASPYVGLWTRLADFSPAELSGALESRALVRIVLMRSTLHLVSARDCLWLRPLLQPMLERGLQSVWGKQLPREVDQGAVGEAGRALVEERPHTFQELGLRLSARWPEAPPQALAQVVRVRVPLVQPPPRGLWGRGGLATHTSAESWLGKGLAPRPSLGQLVRRYLAAFGPATAADAQVWCGLTGLAETFQRLRPQLEVLQDEQGTELFDLPDAPRPAPDLPAPVRFLPDYDNLMFSHADRTRVVSAEFKRRLTVKNGALPPLLVDGWVAGAWKVVREKDRATLQVTPFRRLTPGEGRAVEEEGAALLAFLEPHRRHQLRLLRG